MTRTIPCDQSELSPSSTAIKPPEVIKICRSGGITRVFDPLPAIDSISMGTPELVEFQVDGKESFRAALMLPPGFDGKRPLPAITVVYGAYSVLALLTQTKLFRAAVCNAPIANLTSFYSQQDWYWFESGQGGMGKPPWGDPDAYVRNSPLFLLDQIEASLLLVNGSEDTASARQAEEVFNGLLRLGRKVEWIQYEGADHFTPEWEHTKFEHLCKTMLDWFDEHL